MLVLSRSKGEDIIIEFGNTSARIIICEIEKRSVKLAISAPQEVKVWRGEVLKRITESQAANNKS